MPVSAVVVEVERRRDDHTTEVVGRLAELAALRKGLTGARRGVPAFASISGSAGIGKTSLLRVIADEAKSVGAMVLRGAALEG
jgi:ABC-type nitrate/sulfonate/bicarbonate transport system ATPase subunit